MKTYKDALAAGDSQYLGKACKKAGHAGIRFVSNNTCAACIAEAQKTPKRKEQLQIYRQQLKVREYQIQYQKQYASTDKYKEQKRAYRKNNAAKWTAKTRKYQSAKLQRTPAWLTEDDLWMMEQAYELALLRAQALGFEWHVDHVIPLQGKLASGLHVPHNLQVIPAAVNLSKSNKFVAV